MINRYFVVIFILWSGLCLSATTIEVQNDLRSFNPYFDNRVYIGGPESQHYFLPMISGDIGIENQKVVATLSSSIAQGRPWDGNLEPAQDEDFYRHYRTQKILAGPGVVYSNLHNAFIGLGPIKGSSAKWSGFGKKNHIPRDDFMFRPDRAQTFLRWLPGDQLTLAKQGGIISYLGSIADDLSVGYAYVQMGEWELSFYKTDYNQLIVSRVEKSLSSHSLFTAVPLVSFNLNHSQGDFSTIFYLFDLSQTQALEALNRLLKGDFTYAEQIGSNAEDDSVMLETKSMSRQNQSVSLYAGIPFLNFSNTRFRQLTEEESGQVSWTHGNSKEWRAFDFVKEKTHQMKILKDNKGYHLEASLFWFSKQGSFLDLLANYNQFQVAYQIFNYTELKSNRDNQESGYFALHLSLKIEDVNLQEIMHDMQTETFAQKSYNNIQNYFYRDGEFQDIENLCPGLTRYRHTHRGPKRKYYTGRACFERYNLLTYRLLNKLRSHQHDRVTEKKMVKTLWKLRDNPFVWQALVQSFDCKKVQHFINIESENYRKVFDHKDGCQQ